MLIPFLDILCSLIGVLVLIIVALCVAQTQRAKGITAQQFEISRKFQQLTAELRTLRQQVAEREKGSALEATLQSLAAEKLQLQQSISNAAQIAAKRKQEQDRLAAKITELKAGIAKENAAAAQVTEEITRQKASLAAKQAAAKAVSEPPLVIRRGFQGGGSGLFYFAEAGAKGLLLHVDSKRTLEIPADQVGSSPDYRNFLSGLKAARFPITLVFLIRKEGVNLYRTAAVVAEHDYGINVASLPLPPGGAVDVGAFSSGASLPAR